MSQDLEKSILRILNQQGETAGTGFLVAGGLAVTCAHVIGSAGSRLNGWVNLQWYPDRQKTVLLAQVLPAPWSAPDQDDIAFLRVHSSPPGALPARLASAHRSTGHRYTALGFPKSAAVDARWALDWIAGLVPAPGHSDLLQLKGEEIYHGMSGAPVLDLDLQRVVGMITQGQDDRYTRFAYATSSDTLQKYCPTLVVEDPAGLMSRPPGPDSAENRDVRNTPELEQALQELYADRRSKHRPITRADIFCGLLRCRIKTIDVRLQPRILALLDDFESRLAAAPAPDLFTLTDSAVKLLENAAARARADRRQELGVLDLMDALLEDPGDNILRGLAKHAFSVQTIQEILIFKSAPDLF